MGSLLAPPPLSLLTGDPCHIDIGAFAGPGGGWGQSFGRTIDRLSGNGTIDMSSSKSCKDFKAKNAAAAKTKGEAQQKNKKPGEDKSSRNSTSGSGSRGSGSSTAQKKPGLGSVVGAIVADGVKKKKTADPTAQTTSEADKKKKKDALPKGGLAEFGRRIL